HAAFCLPGEVDRGAFPGCHRGGAARRLLTRRDHPSRDVRGAQDANRGYARRARGAPADRGRRLRRPRYALRLRRPPSRLHGREFSPVLLATEFLLSCGDGLRHSALEGSAPWEAQFYGQVAHQEVIVGVRKAQLESRGHRMLVKNKKEPWGQTVSRFLDPEGLLVGVTFTPFMREAAS